MSNTQKPLSLKEMRKSPDVGPVERTVDICLAGKLVADIEQLDRELAALDDREKASRRIADRSEAREKAEQIEALREQMAKHTVSFRLRGKGSKHWREWKVKHPPRDGVDEDERLGVNFDDLIDSVPDYIVSPDTDTDDWSFVVESASPADVQDAALMVYLMHTQRVDVPKSRLASLVRQRSVAASK